jgi:homoaconitase/3-isopropylmalate dehydratase large subunit
MRFVMDGEMPEYLLAKDLILQIIGEISVAGATYKAMEFGGSAIEGMNMDERMTICNMVVEAGGEHGRAGQEGRGAEVSRGGGVEGVRVKERWRGRIVGR